MIEKKEEKKCYYGCGEPMDEYFRVIKGGILVWAHKRCHRLSQIGAQSTKFVMK